MTELRDLIVTNEMKHSRTDRRITTKSQRKNRHPLIHTVRYSITYCQFLDLKQKRKKRRKKELNFLFHIRAHITIDY